jgi:hypothetical protein
MTITGGAGRSTSRGRKLNGAAVKELHSATDAPPVEHSSLAAVSQSNESKAIALPL